VGQALCSEGESVVNGQWLAQAMVFTLDAYVMQLILGANHGQGSVSRDSQLN
jgi:hypothetical protein